VRGPTNRGQRSPPAAEVVAGEEARSASTCPNAIRVKETRGRVAPVSGPPEGRDWDLIRDERVTEEEARAAVKLIGSLPIPARDPATGEVRALWRQAPRTYGIPF
jgi:hypothetical protein